MASEELIQFLRSVKPQYAQYAQVLHEGSFTDRLELSAADKFDLEALGVPKGPAGVIIKVAQGAGAAAPQAAPFHEPTALAELLSDLDHVPTPEEARRMLLSLEPRRKIPVYGLAAHMAMAPNLVEVVEHKIEKAPLLFSYLISWPVADASEPKTTAMMALFVPNVFKMLASELPGFPALSWVWSQNQAENKKSSASTVSQRLDRPDMLIGAQGATVYIGEDKGTGNIAEARQDVQHYVPKGLPNMSYGEVPYIFAHAAAGSKVQLGLIMADGEVDWMSEIDLIEPGQHAFFVSVLVTMVRIIRRLVLALPPYEFRRMIFARIDRGDGVFIQFLTDRVRKTITKFEAWSTKHAPQSDAESAIKVLISVYNVCNTTSGALVRTVDTPDVNRTGTYKVELQLCGPPARPRTAEHIISLAKACCRAAAELHRAGLVHRDFRLSNVVRSSRSESSYVVIDMEHAGRAGQKGPPLELLRDWDKGTLDADGCYAPSSDVYQIGKMLRSASSGIEMPIQFNDMVKHMLQKSITAEEALLMLP